MWFACGLNIYAMVRSNRNYKMFKVMREKYKKAVEEKLDARDKYYDMIEEYRKRGSDEGNAYDNGCR